MDLSLNSCHFLTLAAILLVFSDRALCADDKRRAIADTRKNVLGKKGSSFASDVMHDGSGGGMSADINWDGSGHGPDDEDADDDLDGQASGHRASDTEVHRTRPAAAAAGAAAGRKHPDDDDDDDDDDGQPSGDHVWEETTTTTTTTQEPTTTTRRRPEPPTTAEDIFDRTDEPPKEETTKAPPPTAPKAQPTQPPTTIYDTENRRTLDPFLRPGILAAVIGGAVVGLLAAILLVMFIVYRMRKKDEGSYALDEPKQPPHYSYAYQKAPTKEFYA